MSSIFRTWLDPVLLALFVKILPWTFSRAYTVHYIPTRQGRSVRSLVFNTPPESRSPKPLRPLHVDIHGGGFLNGFAEMEATFAHQVALRTRAVVVCPTYRLSPPNVFPAAHEDIEGVIRWLLKHAKDKFGADPELMTISGFSAGGNLALAISQIPECQPPNSTAVKAAASFYGSIDLRTPPAAKPRPPNYPTIDPLGWLIEPLTDAYVSPIREVNMENPRLNPILAPVDTLPLKLLIVIGTIDILLNENRTFVQRVKQEIESRGLENERTIQFLEFEGQIHGWLELPSFAIDEKTRTESFDTAIKLLNQTYREHGWDWESR